MKGGKDGITTKYSVARMSLLGVFPSPPVSTHVSGHPPESSGHWGPTPDSDVESLGRGCHWS